MSAFRNHADRASSEDLQMRLAKRLRQIDTGERSVSSWMAVEIGRRSLLLPLSHASELLQWQRPTPVPYTKPWFMGIVSWRGDIFGLIDAARFLDADSPSRSEQALSQCHLLTFNPALEINAALLIDTVTGLKSVNDFEAAHAPMPNSAPAFMGNIYTDLQGKLWQELNLQAFAQQPEFLSIRL
ncbi:chemotaxis protein CheW [Allofranklinella schreckenbergeri]|uniref:Chemotaxis protein CheW n=1 Tax=Allofranklinella schreckenbergeri TaxID=1076744 RepID=A0A3M6Q7M5_9BURK|nr:chemotaxis protein CheW [Allofranklinella schreckenbergeri]RMW99163.1 chemotaxis protein CheW [Allofranklinella schreckenbergeri]